MKSAKMMPQNRIPERGCGLMFAILLLIAVALISAVGCRTTLVPVKVQPAQASFDGTNQNSGVISYDKTNHLGVVTPNWRLRYDSLVSTYSKKFTPPLVADFGLTQQPDGNYQATAEAIVNMGKMELWLRNGIK